MSRQHASAIAAAVNAGSTRAQAVMAQTLARIAAYDAVQPQIWINRAVADDLLAQARAVDARVAAGATGSAISRPNSCTTKRWQRRSG